MDSAARVVGLLTAGGVKLVFHDGFRGPGLLEVCASDLGLTHTPLSSADFLSHVLPWL